MDVLVDLGGNGWIKPCSIIAVLPNLGGTATVVADGGVSFVSPLTVPQVIARLQPPPVEEDPAV